MAANLDDIVGELERLNDSILELIESGQRTQRMNEVGGYTPGQKSFILGAMADLIKDPFGKMIDTFSHQRDLGFKMVQQLDSLEKTNIGSGRDILKIIDELKAEGGKSSFQLGGILDNARLQMAAQNKGFNLRGEGNKILRNQLTLLEDNNMQGTYLLDYTKNLLLRGFSRSEARQALEELTDINYNSIQTVQGNLKLLAALDPMMTMLNIQNVGQPLHRMLRDFVKDADPEYQKQAGEFLRFVFAPTEEDLALHSALGLGEISKDIVAMGKSLEGLDRDSEEYAKTQATLTGMLLQVSNNLESMTEQQLGEYDAAVNAVLRSQRGWTATMLEQMGNAFGLVAAIQMDADVRDTRDKEKDKDGDIFTRGFVDATKNLSFNLEIMSDRFNERLLENSEVYARELKEAGVRMSDAFGKKMETFAMAAPKTMAEALNWATGTTPSMEQKMDEYYGITQDYINKQDTISNQQTENNRLITEVLAKMGMQPTPQIPQTLPVPTGRPSLRGMIGNYHHRMTGQQIFLGDDY